MPVDVLKAILTLIRYCFTQNSCERCEMRKQCGKLPCEWDI